MDDFEKNSAYGRGRTLPHRCVRQTKEAREKKAYLTLLAAAGSGIVAVSAQVGETGRSKTKGHLENPPT
ncbi:protein of unknown function [Methylococcus capsulatus]|uniref:Uncharacterized protein n=1 Tax=Methylococcus capsulatus TaxID=414 RepID=A0AA35UIV5_METCP|nr:protein of unknown function [Methylococcus capsulatus]